MGATVRKNGRWWRLTVNQRGNRKSFRRFHDRRVASLKAKEFEYRLAMEGWGLWEKLNDECFGPYAERQLALWRGGTLKPSTFHTWQHSLQRHVLPTFGRGSPKRDLPCRSQGFL